MATTRINITNLGFTDLGTSPCTIQVDGSKPIIVHVTNAGQPANTAVGLRLSETLGRVKDFTYTSQNVWAKSATSANTSVIVIR